MVAIGSAPRDRRFERHAVRELKRLGFEIDLISHWWRPALVVATILTAIFGAFLLWAVGGASEFKDYLAPVAAIIGISGLLGGLFEWRAGRREAAFRTFYERLDKANASRSSIPQTEEGRVDPMTNYTFIELDNLEIVIELYRMGYITARHALRATRTFASRLKLVWFANRVRHFSGDEEGLSAIGYSPTTNAVVTALLATTRGGVESGSRR